MKKILIYTLSFVLLISVVQTFRFNYTGRNVRDFQFFDVYNNKILLKNVFNKSENKFIVYILPQCESCIDKIDELLKLNGKIKSQIIIISVGLKYFDFKKFYQTKLKNKELIFLVVKNNIFYRDFGLGFREEFPTVIKYNLIRNDFFKL